MSERIAVDQLLAAVDVVRRAGERGVGHQVHGERGDVVRPDDAPDRQRRAQLLAARLEPVAEQRRRQRRVDEPGGDEVDPDRRELDAPGSRSARARAAVSAAISVEADAAPAAAGAADEDQRAAGPHLAGGEAGDARSAAPGAVDVAPRTSAKSISASGA